MCISSSCHTLLHRDEIVKPNPRVVELLAVSVVIEKIRHRRSDSRKYELVK